MVAVGIVGMLAMWITTMCRAKRSKPLDSGMLGFMCASSLAGLFMMYGAIMSLLDDQSTAHFTSFHLAFASLAGFVWAMVSVDKVVKMWRAMLRAKEK